MAPKRRSGRSGKSGWPKHNLHRARTGVRSDVQQRRTAAVAAMEPLPAACPMSSGSAEVAAPSAAAPATAPPIVPAQLAEQHVGHLGDKCPACAHGTVRAALVMICDGCGHGQPQDAARVEASVPGAPLPQWRPATQTSQPTATPDPPQLRHGELSCSALSLPVQPEGWGAVGPPRPETRSVGVGEHVSGEPILWRGIFDMP